MNTVPLDDALVKSYEEFNVPVDQFIGDSKLTESFVSTIQAKVGDLGLDTSAIMRRLVNLRKKGRLPRLRRNFYGRSDCAS